MCILKQLHASLKLCRSFRSRPKTAQRLALFYLVFAAGEVVKMARAIVEAKIKRTTAGFAVILVKKIYAVLS